MPYGSNRVPSYRLHKPTNQAVVTLNGKDFYLGVHGTEESRIKYDRLIAEYLASRRRHPEGNKDGLTITGMILAIWKQAEEHYRFPDGRATGELANMRDALRPLEEMYGSKMAVDFGPLALRALREGLIEKGLSRTTINARINRIRRAFKWAASLELIPVTISQALSTVPGLQRGRCAAKESPGIKPVSWDHVEKTLPHLPGTIAAMVQIMRYTNCRAEDVVIVREGDLQMDGDIWRYQPADHKNAWRGHDHVIFLGRQAQDILRPFLRSQPEQFLFRPADAVAEHHAKRRQLRKTKRTPSEQRLLRAKRPKQSLMRKPGPRYTVNTFQQAIRRACRRAKVPEWSVLQLRHTRATEIRERFGIEGAAAILGHRRVETSQIYAEKNEQLSRKIASEIG